MQFLTITEKKDNCLRTCSWLQITKVECLTFVLTFPLFWFHIWLKANAAAEQRHHECGWSSGWMANWLTLFFQLVFVMRWNSMSWQKSVTYPIDVIRINLLSFFWRYSKDFLRMSLVVGTKSLQYSRNVITFFVVIREIIIFVDDSFQRIFFSRIYCVMKKYHSKKMIP